MTAAAKIAEALLPCPYCGSVTRISGFSKRIGKATPTVFQTAQVKCNRQSCGMSGPLAKGDGCRAMAVDTFNAVARRAKRADALAQENAKLRGALRHIVNAEPFFHYAGVGPSGMDHTIPGSPYDRGKLAGYVELQKQARAALGDTP